MAFQHKIPIESIRFEDLSFQYESETSVFAKLSFDFPMNECVWVRSSATGAGRSTLMQLLAGLLSAQAGKFLINDRDVNQMTFDEFLPYRLSIGYTFDLGGLLHNRTIFENLQLPLLYHNLMSREESEEKVNVYLKAMGITKYKDQRPTAVPGSVRKITCLIRPLLMNPQLLLLDDPSLGLGQESVLRYLDLIQTLRNQGIVRHIYVSTFDEKLMSLLEHNEIYLDEGQLIQVDRSPLKKVVHL
jgi:phospholipid/cholesterol/gamma-HCH transport system ATP-binding protein